MKPVTALALATDPQGAPVAPGVATRLTMSWALGTAVPLLAAVTLCGAGEAPQSS